MSRRIAFFRHGRTTWNADNRIQGQTDTALSADGVRALEGRRVPPPFDAAGWTASPLRRALDTAHLLGAVAVEAVPALAEMDWGEWQGRTREEIRRSDPDDLAARERLGLDFRPPGGESPREVRARLQGWLRTLGDGDTPIVAVTHRGVLRAALSLATGWDLTAAPPHALLRDCVHVFDLKPGGGLAVHRLNVDLVPPASHRR